MQVEIELLEAGSCKHPEGMVLGTFSLKPVVFPALVLLIRHPTRGLVLFDGGYDPRVFEAARAFPYSLYLKTLPACIEPEQRVVAQLAARGHSVGDVSHVVLSHFHPDHVGALLDFPSARVVAHREGLLAARKGGAIRHLLNGYLPGLVPDDIDERLQAVEELPQVALGPALAPFETAFDLFGDGSLLAVDLSGHVQGQLGLYARLASGAEAFFVADACYNRLAFEELRLPAAPVRLITYDHRRYVAQIHKLHELHRRRPELHLVPSHCTESIRRFRER